MPRRFAGLVFTVTRVKRTDADKLQDEYSKLVEGLHESITDSTDEDAFMTNPGK